MSLFSKAKAKATAKPAKAKQEKTRLSVPSDIKNEFFGKIKELEKLDNEIKSRSARRDMIADEVKDTAKTEWVKAYKKTGVNPGSVMVESRVGEDTAQLMFVPQDKYITINKERAEELIETYGEDIVTEDTKFSFDQAMVEKYGEVISNLIENSDEIDEEDKAAIIKAVSVFTIKKGTIDRLKEFGEGDIESVMEAVKPITGVRDISVING